MTRSYTLWRWDGGLWSRCAGRRIPGGDYIYCDLLFPPTSALHFQKPLKNAVGTNSYSVFLYWPFQSGNSNLAIQLWDFFFFSPLTMNCFRNEEKPLDNWPFAKSLLQTASVQSYLSNRNYAQEASLAFGRKQYAEAVCILATWQLISKKFGGWCWILCLPQDATRKMSGVYKAVWKTARTGESLPINKSTYVCSKVKC